MKIYTNKVQVGNVEAGNFFIYDEDTKSYIMSKGNTDISENAYSTSESYISLPVSAVENNDVFEQVGVAVEKSETNTILDKVEKRMKSVQETIKLLEESKTVVDSAYSAALDETISSLQKEYWTLQWVLTLN